MMHYFDIKRYYVGEGKIVYSSLGAIIQGNNYCINQKIIPGQYRHKICNLLKMG